MLFLAHRTLSRPLLCAACLILLPPLAPRSASASIAAGIALDVHWAPSPPADSLGNPLPAAAAYEVWLTAGARPESMVTTVTDTQYVLNLPEGDTYVVRVRAVAADGRRSVFSPPSDPLWVEPQASPADTPPALVDLGRARPNPFNARTSITYRVPPDLSPGDALGLAIFDLRGRRVGSLPLQRSPGEHQVEWDARDAAGRRLPSGMYVARFRCGAYLESLKLALVS